MVIDILAVCETRWKGSGNYNLKILELYIVEVLNQEGMELQLYWEEKKEECCGYISLQWEDNYDKDKTKTSRFMCYSSLGTNNSQYRWTNRRYVCEKIDELMKFSKEKDNHIVLGDFNASVGENVKSRWICKHGLGKMNTRGARLLDFCEQYEMFVTYRPTCFEVPNRWRYTWKMTDDSRSQ